MELTIVVIIIVFLFIRHKNKVKRQKDLATIIAVQNIVSPVASNQLTMSTKKLNSEVNDYIAKRMKRIKTATEQLNQTTDPEVYFQKIELIRKLLLEIDTLDRAGGTLIKTNASQLSQQLDDQLFQDIDRMIDRSFRSALIAASKLTTEQGKENRILSYFDTMRLFEDDMYPENIEHLNQLQQNYLDGRY